MAPRKAELLKFPAFQLPACASLCVWHQTRKTHTISMPSGHFQARYWLAKRAKTKPFPLDSFRHEFPELSHFGDGCIRLCAQRDYDRMRQVTNKEWREIVAGAAVMGAEQASCEMGADVGMEVGTEEESESDSSLEPRIFPGYDVKVKDMQTGEIKRVVMSKSPERYKERVQDQNRFIRALRKQAKKKDSKVEAHVKQKEKFRQRTVRATRVQQLQGDGAHITTKEKGGQYTPSITRMAMTCLSAGVTTKKVSTVIAGILGETPCKLVGTLPTETWVKQQTLTLGEASDRVVAKKLAEAKTHAQHGGEVFSLGDQRDGSTKHCVKVLGQSKVITNSKGDRECLVAGAHYTHEATAVTQFRLHKQTTQKFETLTEAVGCQVGYKDITFGQSDRANVEGATTNLIAKAVQEDGGQMVGIHCVVHGYKNVDVAMR